MGHKQHSDLSNVSAWWYLYIEQCSDTVCCVGKRYMLSQLWILDANKSTYMYRNRIGA